MQTIRKTTINVTTTGSAGSASGSSSATVGVGELVALHVDYTSQPATTDVTITSPSSPSTRTLLTVSNNATDGYYFPSDLLDDSTGADITGAAKPAFVQAGVLTVAVAQGDAATNGVTVTAWVRE